MKKDATTHMRFSISFRDRLKKIAVLRGETMETTASKALDMLEREMANQDEENENRAYITWKRRMEIEAELDNLDDNFIGDTVINYPVQGGELVADIIGDMEKRKKESRKVKRETPSKTKIREIQYANSDGYDREAGGFTDVEEEIRIAKIEQLACYRKRKGI